MVNRETPVSSHIVGACAHERGACPHMAPSRLSPGIGAAQVCAVEDTQVVLPSHVKQTRQLARCSHDLGVLVSGTGQRLLQKPHVPIARYVTSNRMKPRRQRRRQKEGGRGGRRRKGKGVVRFALVPVCIVPHGVGSLSVHDGLSDAALVPHRYRCVFCIRFPHLQGCLEPKSSREEFCHIHNMQADI